MNYPYKREAVSSYFCIAPKKEGKPIAGLKYYLHYPFQFHCAPGNENPHVIAEIQVLSWHLSHVIRRDLLFPTKNPATPAPLHLGLSASCPQKKQGILLNGPSAECVFGAWAAALFSSSSCPSCRVESPTASGSGPPTLSSAPVGGWTATINS